MEIYVWPKISWTILGRFKRAEQILLSNPTSDSYVIKVYNFKTVDLLSSI